MCMSVCVMLLHLLCTYNISLITVNCTHKTLCARRVGVLLHDSTLVTKQPFAKPAAVMSSAEDIARFLNKARNSNGDPLLLEAIEAYLYKQN